MYVSSTEISRESAVIPNRKFDFGDFSGYYHFLLSTWSAVEVHEALV
jgi:hypothetical protein